MVIYLKEMNYLRLEKITCTTIAMGGRVAEEIIFGEDKVTTGAAK